MLKLIGFPVNIYLLCLNSYQQTVSDINECEEKPCAHTCMNTNGSFICDCNVGYSLSADGVNCTGILAKAIYYE